MLLFFSWHPFAILGNIFDLYLISNEEPSKGQSKFTLIVNLKTAQNIEICMQRSHFVKKVAILTKIRP